ncbi:MAG: hypothetical protein HFG57_11000 [Lachnospiraceae bacterium]|nr:hypothetical protein [Lachnospiraceae bacterium]
MSKEKGLKISWRVLLAGMFILTVLFFLDIKFVVLGINILVLDMLTVGIWAFVRLCRWAGRENTEKRTIAVIAIILMGLFAAPVLLFGLGLEGGWYEYAEGTEPQTHRTFVVEYRRNMLQKGTAKVYERFGPVLFPCDVPEYSGNLALDELDAEYASVYISEEQQAITVSLFIYGPRFHIPLKLPEGTAKTPERVRMEQPVDDDHGAFLVDTGGRLGKLLVTTELERTPTEDCELTVYFSIWNPASMDEPLQTMTSGTNFRPNCYAIDANFDGYGDFTCTYIHGTQVYYDHLWIWNEENSQFEGIPEYGEISAPDLDERTKTIYGFTPSSGGGTGLHTFHQWASGNLLCMRQIEIYHIGKSDTVRMSIQDRIANELVEIYYEDFSSESSGWLDAQMVWHDLDYHGEPGGIYDVIQQQIIDDTHDAFLVSTRGKLGTLLVTAELAEENKDEFGSRDITFSVWNPVEMEQPIQTFSEEFMMGVAPEFHHVVDANFDGFQDFGYLFHAGNQPNYWRYWLWDEEQAQFIYYAPLGSVSSPGFDADRQIVTGWARSWAAGGTHSFYCWMDGELVLVREINIDFTKMIVVKDLIDGQMVEVYREEWEEKDEGDVLDILSKWYDLDYHNE